MKRINLALGDWNIKVYSGPSEWKQYKRLHDDTTGQTLPDYPESIRGQACLNGLWVEDLKDIPILAHELIHTLSILHEHIGIKDQCPYELLAYQHSYCLKKLMKAS